MGGQRILGIDWGTKRLGIAISDPGASVAHGRQTYTRTSLDGDLEYLGDMVEDNDVKEIVVGVPLNMDGTRGPQAEKSHAFKEKLEEELELPVKMVDERLTSREAERVLLDADLTREQRREKRDQLAATLILQRHLDSSGQ